MSEASRKDPRRPSSSVINGVRRIALAARNEHSNASDAPLPVRSCDPPERWLMAVVRSDRGGLDGASLQAIAAAALLADKATGVLVVPLGGVSGDLAAAGADLVAVFDDFGIETYQPEHELAALMAVIAAYKPAHIFLPDDHRGLGDLGRRLIVALEDDGATHVVELGPTHTAVQWAGGDGVLARRAMARVVMLDAGAVDPDLPFRGAGRRLDPDQIPATALVSATCRDLGIEIADATSVALEEADLVISAGHGVKATATLETLAATLGAAVGASRVAVDEGKYPRERQIGATGKTISARGYIAVGISGAVQHLQGIKDCRHVIAINTDAGAPIVKRADLTLIGDAEGIMQALITRVDQAKAQREVPETKP